MLCLGIESTAHTFGIGIASDKGEILANCKSVYKPPEGWGIKPIDAANHHKEVAEKVLSEALEKSGKKLEDIDFLAFSQGPGLPPCLRVGKDFILGLAKETGKKIIGVNHPCAHIEIAKLTTNCKDPVILYVSGANTQIISLVDKYYRVFGEVQDIGIGNALDKFAREVGIGFPGGPEIERLANSARHWSADQCQPSHEKYIELPYVVKGMDLSFTGIVTEATRKIKSGYKKEDVCFSLQETTFAMLTEVTERALAHTGKQEVLLTGGVAANKRLQEMLGIMCKERGAKFFACPKEYSGDNGAMIACVGILAHKSDCRTFDPKTDDINPTWRIDEVEIRWI